MFSSTEAINKIQNTCNIKFSDEQLKILEYSGGMSILACAGSGKTTILSYLIAKRVLVGEIKNLKKVLCTTYSKSGATEVETRISDIFKKLGVKSTLTVKTMHAVCYEVMDYFGEMQEVIDNRTRRKFILESCKDIGVKLPEEDFVLLDTLLSYQINNLLSDDRVARSYNFNIEGIDLAKYSAIREGYAKRKQESGYIDYDDMQLFLYFWLVKENRQDVLQYCRNRWTDFYIDEAQDLSKIQFAIVRRLIDDTSKSVFIGDDDQCIYQWRGADPSIILNICGYLDLKKFILSTNYRCKENIVKCAERGIRNNNKREEKGMKTHEVGGEIKICDTGGGDIYNQTKYAYKYILGLIEEKSVNLNDIAVLSRNNNHMSILNNMLFRRGIQCDIPPEMRFTGGSMYECIKNIIDLAENSRREEVTEKTLWMLCRYLGLKGAGDIAKLQGSVGAKLSDVLMWLVLEGYGVKDADKELHCELKLSSLVAERARVMLKSLNSNTINDIQDLCKLLSVSDADNRTINILNHSLNTMAFMRAGSKDKIRLAEGSVKYIVDIIKKSGVKGLKSLMKATEHYENGKYVNIGGRICLSTIHGAKGREWKHVLLFADDNITFPSFEGIATMQKRKVEMQDIKDSLDENRRLHYVCMTRAKDELIIFTDKNDVGVYTLESLGLINGSGNSNISIMSMVGRGGLDGDLVKRVKQELFSNQSTYKLELNVDDIDIGESELEKRGTGDKSNGSSVNVSDMFETASRIL